MKFKIQSLLLFFALLMMNISEAKTFLQADNDLSSIDNRLSDIKNDGAVLNSSGTEENQRRNFPFKKEQSDEKDERNEREKEVQDDSTYLSFSDFSEIVFFCKGKHIYTILHYHRDSYQSIGIYLLDCAFRL